MAKKSLGRGLGALIGSIADQRENEVSYVKTESLVPGKFQPRTEFDEESLLELANSIKRNGIIQPVIVRRIKNDKYEIIAGERRWRAALQAGLESIPVLIRELDDSKALLFSLIENIQRENLNPIDEANAIRRLIEEFGLTQEQVAEHVGKSRSTVANLLRLLELPEEVRVKLSKGIISLGHAKAILMLRSPESQKELAEIIERNELSVRDAEKVARLMTGQRKKKSIQREMTLRKLEKDLTEYVGKKTKIKLGKRGASLVIKLDEIAEIDTIKEKIKRILDNGK